MSIYINCRRACKFSSYFSKKKIENHECENVFHFYLITTERISSLVSVMKRIQSTDLLGNCLVPWTFLMELLRQYNVGRYLIHLDFKLKFALGPLGPPPPSYIPIYVCTPKHTNKEKLMGAIAWVLDTSYILKQKKI